MADKTGIEWTDATWNPIVGCSIVSPGCTNCYAMKMAARIERMNPGNHYAGTTKASKGGAVWTGKLALAPDHILTAPLRWKRPRKIFVNSMGDVFHEDAPDAWIDKVFAVMALCDGTRSNGRHHTFQVLTKRADRMRRYMTDPETPFRVSAEVTFRVIPGWRPTKGGLDWTSEKTWPLPNVWLGVSTERQKEADERIPLLLQTPAAVRFISAEPLLGPIDLDRGGFTLLRPIKSPSGKKWPGLDWVIVGGESGPNARPFHIEWADEIVSQCSEAGVDCFVKQFGSMPMSDGYPLELRDRAGGDPAEWPDRLNLRQFPQTRQQTGKAA